MVIVMLTPLAENGTKQCHQYWPDEGSDLYHIYEVTCCILCAYPHDYVFQMCYSPLHFTVFLLWCWSTSVLTGWGTPKPGLGFRVVGCADRWT